MLIHSVYFWFKAEVDTARAANFEDGLRSLASIELVRQGYFGRPEATPLRPVIDKSYDWALVLHFETLADHDAYQDHPVHLEFLDRFATLWEKVLVYDVRI